MSMEMTTTRAQRKTEPRTWNPRYLAYASAHGKTPEAMLDADTAYRSSDKIGFKPWIRWAWQTWDAMHNCGPTHCRTDQEEHEFTAWLVHAIGVTP